MSQPQTNLVAPPAGKISLASALSVAAVFAVFIVIYLISRQAPHAVGSASGATEDDAWKYSSEGRSGKLAEMRGKEHTAATSYGWVDKEKGVVHLPIDRAMELTLRDLNASRK